MDIARLELRRLHQNFKKLQRRNSIRNWESDFSWMCSATRWKWPVWWREFDTRSRNACTFLWWKTEDWAWMEETIKWSRLPTLQSPQHSCFTLHYRGLPEVGWNCCLMQNCYAYSQSWETFHFVTLPFHIHSWLHPNIGENKVVINVWAITVQPKRKRLWNKRTLSLIDEFVFNNSYLYELFESSLLLVIHTSEFPLFQFSFKPRGNKF